MHLYNAMPPFTHRAPGVIGAVMDSPHVDAELICDGVHIHPSAVRAAFRMLGADRIVFISDSMRATGMPDGRYTLGGLDVDVTGNRAVLASDGALAGRPPTCSTACAQLSGKWASRWRMRWPAPRSIPRAALASTTGTAPSVPGKKADFLLLDTELNLKAVVKDGKVRTTGAFGA